MTVSINDWLRHAILQQTMRSHTFLLLILYFYIRTKLTYCHGYRCFAWSVCNRSCLGRKWTPFTSSTYFTTYVDADGWCLDQNIVQKSQQLQVACTLVQSTRCRYRASGDPSGVNEWHFFCDPFFWRLILYFKI